MFVTSVRDATATEPVQASRRTAKSLSRKRTSPGGGGGGATRGGRQRSVRVRGRARRRRPLEISEPRRRRLGVAGDDAVRRVDDARARRGPPAAAEGRVGERRVEVAVVAPPAFFFILWWCPRRGRIFDPGLTRIEDFFRTLEITNRPTVQVPRGVDVAVCRSAGLTGW